MKIKLSARSFSPQALIRSLRRVDPFHVAAVLPLILTSGVLAYAASVMIERSSSEKEAPAMPAQQRPAAKTDTISAKPALDVKQQEPSAPEPSAKPIQASLQTEGLVLRRSEDQPASADRMDNTRREGEGQPGSLATATIRDLHKAADARAVQNRLRELGHFSGPANGVWGPLSRAALRSFKEASDLGSDAAWDAATQSALFRADAQKAEAFVGRWASDAKGCSFGKGKSGYLPTIIESSRAQAGDASCTFKEKRPVGQDWHITAQCVAAKSQWTARIQLSVKGDRLTWTSERGSQTYVRCESNVEFAAARSR